jgi:hypothetical protein
MGLCPGGGGGGGGGGQVRKYHHFHNNPIPWFHAQRHVVGDCSMLHVYVTVYRQGATADGIYIYIHIPSFHRISLRMWRVRKPRTRRMWRNDLMEYTRYLFINIYTFEIMVFDGMR